MFIHRSRSLTTVYTHVKVNPPQGCAMFNLGINSTPNKVFIYDYKF